VSFPPVPSTEITKDGRNLSPAWVAFFSQVFSNAGINASAVNTATPVFSGNVTVANLNVTGAITAAGAATFNGAMTANSTASFAGPMTLGSTLSGVSASFTGPISGTTGTFTSGAVGNLTFSTTNIASNAGMTFQTTPSVGSATTALTIDQSRVFITNQANVSGPVPDPGYATCLLGGNFVYTDTVSLVGAINAYGISYNYYAVSIESTNTAVTYTNGITFFVSSGMVSGVNATVTNSWAFWTDTGSVNFSFAFYVSDNSDSKAFTGALCTNGVLGYGTHPVSGVVPSPGGAVTQSTSKSQGVTLNKGCGAITMNAAALAAGASVQFVLTNSFIAAFDTIICNMGPGGTASTYLVQCQAVAAGSCRFRVTNYSGTSRSEACVVNFSIIKAVNA